MSVKPLYRIRGLTEMNVSEPERPEIPLQNPSSTSLKAAVPLPTQSLPDDVNFKLLAAALGDVTLSDYLHIGSHQKLRKFWPTCDFFKSRRTPFSVKNEPLVIGEYMCGDEFEFRRLYRDWTRHKEERDMIHELLSLAETGGDILDIPNEIPPIASAIASHLFRGSPGFQSRRNQLLDLTCGKPEAAYLGLLSGTWPHATNRLIETLQADPRLALEVFRHPALTQAASMIKLEDILLAAPALCAFSPYLNVMDGEEQAWAKLTAAAEFHPMAAAVVLGLSPQSRDWIDIVKTSPEAMYWAVRIGVQRFEAEELSYWNEFRVLVSLDAKWGYHWTRDFESGLAFDYIERHWPDPWTVELAVDLQLSGTSMARHYRQAKHDARFITHGLVDSVTLWVHEFSKNKNDDEDES